MTESKNAANEAYLKIIERPYKVYYGEQEWVWYLNGKEERATVSWTYVRSFWSESEAETYAERLSEKYEFVKIERKSESN